MAEVLHHYFPKLVQMHNYSSANGLRQKRCNWETLNRKVLSRLGVEISREEVQDIVNCKPRAIEKLLKLTRVQILKHQAMKHDGREEARVKTPDGSEFSFCEEGEDANNRHHISGFGKMRTSSVESLRNSCISQIPRAPSQGSVTPPPPPLPTPTPTPTPTNLRPKSSLETCSIVERDLMVKELQETNELLLAKINKLEELLRLKDKKIDSLSAKLNFPYNYSGVMTPCLPGGIDLRS